MKDDGLKGYILYDFNSYHLWNRQNQRRKKSHGGQRLGRREEQVAQDSQGRT